MIESNFTPAVGNWEVVSDGCQVTYECRFCGFTYTEADPLTLPSERCSCCGADMFVSSRAVTLPYKPGNVATGKAEGVLLSKSQAANLAEFLECHFIDALRRDVDIDNIGYVVDMCDAYKKLRAVGGDGA